LKTREDEGEDSVPGLSKIPILGWLFKKELKKTESQELLIFITPRIVKQ
jgi:type IV pilus assembly protein PilQ